MLIPVSIQTLILSHNPAPSVLVLQPTNEVNPSKNGRIIPIWIGSQEAAQIGLALENIKLPRPLTHDLLLDALTNLDSFIDHVVINDVKTTVFYSKVVLRHHGRLIQLDARPSDSITLALRQGAPIYMDKNVLERASYPYIFRGDQQINDEELERFHSFITSLSPEDFQNNEN